MTALDAGAVLGALGDPTRREIVTRLADRVEATATELAAGLPVTRQAVAKHLATLREARLVSRRRVGREARYRLEVDTMAAARDWIAQVEATWDARLDRLAALAERDE